MEKENRLNKHSKNLIISNRIHGDKKGPGAYTINSWEGFAPYSIMRRWEMSVQLCKWDIYNEFFV